MSQIQNPAKGFQFNILIAGINPFTVQDVKQPDWGFEKDVHGDANYKVNTAGMMDIGTLTIQKIVNGTAPGLDKWLWSKLLLIQNPITGGGLLPSEYKEIIIIQQLAANNIVPLQTWTWEGCFPLKINGVEFSRMKSENTIHTIEFSVDRPLV